jgi:hypothetical protein
MRTFFFLAGLVFVVVGIVTPITDHPRKVKMVVGLPRYKQPPAPHGSKQMIDGVISERPALVLMKTLSVVGGLGMIWVSRYPAHRISTVPTWLRFQRRVRRRGKVDGKNEA